MATQHVEKYSYPRILRILTDIGQAVAGFCKRDIITDITFSELFLYRLFTEY